MSHVNRPQVRIPRRLWDEMMLALDQALARIEALDPDPAIVTRQIFEFGRRVLSEARRREPEAPE
ncbi:MAG: hypothetical protein ACREU9_00165 [Gammaproteobacteria bacterium]